MEGPEMRRYAIGVIGDAHLEAAKRKLAAALAQQLIDANYRIVSGGHGDLAKALAEGARRSARYRDGDLITILPGFDPSVADEYSDITIATGIDHARNLIVANSDAVIAIGGGAGTLSEIALAWALKRLILAYRVDGWSGKLAGTRIDSRSRYPELPDDQVYPVDKAEEAIRYLAEMLPKYSRRHTKITVRKEER
jgi:uncharacterized protein (TIGR00725 family)